MNHETTHVKNDFIQDFFENFDSRFLFYVTKKSILFVVITLLICLLIPYIYLRYTTPIFETTATLIKKRENTNSPIDGNNVDIFKSNEEDKIDRDIQVIKSDLLINKIIDSLGLRIQYFKKGRMFYKRFELMPKSSFHVANNSEIYNKQLVNSEIEINFKDDNNYDLTYFLDGAKICVPNLKTGKTYKNDDLKLKIEVMDKAISGSYVVIFNSDQAIRNYISSQIQVTNANPNIYFSVKSTIPQKSELLLQKIISEFLILDQKENSERLENSIQYIENYLDTMNSQVRLSQVEKREYVQSNNAFEPSAQLTSSMMEMEQYKKEIEALELKIELLEKIKHNAHSNPNLSIEFLRQKEDKELLQLINEKNKLLIDYKPNHPVILILDKQISRHIQTKQESLNQEIIEARQRLSKYILRKNNTLSTITDLPEKSMELSKIQKELEIKERFVYDLIEKQIQYLILKSSISASYLIIQEPKTKESQIYPRVGLAYFGGIILFLFTSIFCIFWRYMRFDKVVSIDEIKRKTNVHILGYIPFIPEAYDAHVHKKRSPESKLVVLSNFKSRVSEVFKKIRASMKYTSAGEYKTICSTSTIPGEGKTFVLINLAAVHALLDKKVLIIDLDLRKPRISKSLKIPNTNGMSNLLSDKNILVSDCIQKSIEIENLDVITSGPIPPNPSELITSARFDTILEELKMQYDYIFIDTPPIGLVNESIEIVNKVDISLYLVKMNHSHKDFAHVLNETNRLKKNTNLFLVINHFGEGPSAYLNTNHTYGYSYSSKNGEQEGYYTEKIEPKRKGTWQSLMKLFDWKL